MVFTGLEDLSTEKCDQEERFVHWLSLNLHAILSVSKNHSLLAKMQVSA